MPCHRPAKPGPDLPCCASPRAAIGYDDTYVYSVVVDGRTDGDVGMSLTELAEYMTERLGLLAALNLDGRGSATLASRSLRGVASAVAPIFGGLLMVADLIVKLLLGPKWAGSDAVLAQLAPAGFFI